MNQESLDIITVTKILATSCKHVKALKVEVYS